MTRQAVSFFTICYEADWRSLLLRGRLSALINSCNYSFAHRGLIINNVQDRAIVELAAAKAVEDGIIDAFYFSEDQVDAVLNNFNISRKSFKLDGYDGFWYSIAPLTSIFFCKTSYLLFFTGDCIVSSESDPKWIDLAIGKLTDEQFLVANPLWAYSKGEHQQESTAKDEAWFIGRGFTDQCFLIPTATFNKDIYNYYHVSSEAYPIYGGNLFERRVNSYMQKFGKLRLTSKIASFDHTKLIDDEYQAVHVAPNKFKSEFYSLKKRVRKKINSVLISTGLHV